MKLLIGLIVALFAAVGLALLVQQDSGYVLLSAGQWTIETSFVAFAIFSIIAFVVLYLVVRYLVRLWNAPRTVKTAAKRYRDRKGQRLLDKGMKELAEGRWAAAEASLSKGLANSDAPVLNYIGAARAAHRLNAPVRRDGYLRKAEDLPEQDALAVGLFKAELLLEQGKYAEAKDVLLRFRHAHSHNPRLLELLAQIHRNLGEWAQLKEILPQLQKRKALDEPQVTELQREMYQNLLDNAARSGTLEDMKAIWNEAPAHLRSDEALLIHYVGHLRDRNAADEAEVLLRGALTQHWSDKLVVGYGEMGRGDVSTQLEAAEGWLQHHEKDPYLLLTLGRLAKRAHQLEKARGYFEKSVKLLPSPDAYQELGEVLEQMDDKENATLCYRTGLRLLTGQPEAKKAVELIPAGGPKELAKGEKPADAEAAASEESRQASA